MGGREQVNGQAEGLIVNVFTPDRNSLRLKCHLSILGYQSRHFKALGKLFHYAVLLQAVDDLLWSNHTHLRASVRSGKARELGLEDGMWFGWAKGISRPLQSVAMKQVNVSPYNPHPADWPGTCSAPTPEVIGAWPAVGVEVTSICCQTSQQLGRPPHPH